MTRGLQLGEDERYLKTAVTLKHWAAYSLENSDNFTRHNFNAVVSNFALANTYFPAFKKAVVGAKASGVMCSYNSLNGIPTCASPLLTKVLRDAWQFDGYVTSDSGAIEDLYTQHHYVNSSLSAIRPALVDGATDVCSGQVYTESLLSALNSSLIQREDIDLALAHTFKLRMRLGLFDPATPDHPYWNLNASVIGTPESAATNLLATRSSMVLLKNTAFLPLPMGKRIALIGPHGNATNALVGNYLGQICPDNSKNNDCLISPFQALQTLNQGGSVTMTLGSPLTKNDTSGFADAIAAAKAADFVILALGIDLSVEGEAHDRTSIDLPLIQHQLAAAIAAVGVPTVSFILRGGPVDITAELSNPAIGGIIDAGYPGILGGQVIAETLFGMNEHLGGKLAQTLYKASFVDEIDMSEMEVDVGVGRGYRYYTGDSVALPFGYGLSYTSFSLVLSSGPSTSTLLTEVEPTTILTYSLLVTNTGTVTGDEVVQAYFLPQSTPSQPSSRLLKQLFAYQRVHLAAGESVTVNFSISTETLRFVDKLSGNMVSTPGVFTLSFTNGVALSVNSTVNIQGTEVVCELFPGA